MRIEFKRRAIQGLSVAVAFSAMSVTTVLNSTMTNIDKKETNVSRTAGIITNLNSMQVTAMNAVEVEDSKISVVAATETTNPQWSNRLMADVDEFLNVRETPSEEGSIVGKIRKGDVADIVSTEGEWTQITSGNVNGYVNNAYCVTGDDACELANEICETYATSQTVGLRVRSEADENASVMTTLSEGGKLAVAKDAPAVEGWVAVSYKGNTGYVSSEYVTVDMDLGKAITLEEEQAAIKAAQEAKAAEEAKKAAQQKTVATTQNAAVSASYDDVTLLAALIQSEAGCECYDGQVAVGAVIMNRVRSGAYPGSISGVIYQSGQFGPAGSGKVASVAANGPSGSCISAAQAALSGVDNTGGALYFKNVRSGHAGVAIGNHVFY